MKYFSNSKTGPFSVEKQRLFEQLLREGGIALPPRLPIPKRNTAEPCRLTPAQERLWRAWQAEPRRTGQNEVVRLRLSGSLNVTALDQALNSLVRRHELLRTRFVEINGHLIQQAAASINLEVSLADLSRLPASAQAASCERLCGEHADMAFALEQLPLFSSSLIALNAHEQLLQLTLHQIICDDWSKKILVDELRRSYELITTGLPCSLNELKIGYGDYVMWQRGRLEAGEFHQDLEYWRQRSGGGLPPERLGARAGREMAARGPRKRCQVSLGDAASRLARQVSRSEGLTLYMILLTGWQVLLNRYSGQEEIAVSIVVANRNRTELQSLVGPLSNLLLIKLDLSGNPSFRVILHRLKARLAEAFDHQEVPCEWVVAQAATDGFPDVTFAMEDPVALRYQTGALKIIKEGPETGASYGHLALVMREAGRVIEGRIEYDSSLFDEAPIAQMAASYQKLVEVMLADLDCKIKNMPPLAD
jgi:hypothetical protein